MRLEVMLVEDQPEDMHIFVRDLPNAFQAAGCEVCLHPYESFDGALKAARDPSRRFDLILSDTYQGEHERHDAAVIAMVNLYRNARFCPLVVFSSASKPDDLEESTFLQWADKAGQRTIEAAIQKLLTTGVPQLARLLHQEIESVGAEYIWKFVSNNWDALSNQGATSSQALERLVRTRAALMIANRHSEAAGSDVFGLEYYICPPVSSTLSLGQVMRRKDDQSDLRVVVTPHCFLTIQPNQNVPRAEYVRVVKVVEAATALGKFADQIRNAKTDADRASKLRKATTPPARWCVPEGRYWYLPQFLGIPHSYCDFLQVDSIPMNELQSEYESIAVLTSPFAESLQACLRAFDGSVGVPTVDPTSLSTLV